MSQPVPPLPLPFELVIDDGIPMGNHLHVLQMELLRDLVIRVMEERGRNDFYAAGNVFVYYSVEQARDVAEGRPYPQGPDFFFVQGVPPRKQRKCWVAWEEGGRLPDLIVELLSPSTEWVDRNEKPELYAGVFRTPEYYLYTMETAELEGLHLVQGSYQPMVPNAQGRFESKVLGLELGLWHGEHQREETTWLRLFTPDGQLVPSSEEAVKLARAERIEAEQRYADAVRRRVEAEQQRIEAERRRADGERRRAEAAEAALKRLRALLGEP